MPVPATLSNLLSLPDILDTSRGYLFFPQIPGGGDNAQLTLLGCNVSIPQTHIGHVRVPLFGHTVGFRGHRDHGNLFTASFYETREAIGHYSLLAWMALCNSSADDTSLLKEQYAVTCFYDQYDPRGDLSYRFRLSAVWPQSFTTPPSSESSAASRMEMSFSVDFIDLVAAGSKLPTANYNYSNTPLEDAAGKAELTSTSSSTLAYLTAAEFGQFTSSALSGAGAGPALPMTVKQFENLVGGAH